MIYRDLLRRLDSSGLALYSARTIARSGVPVLRYSVGLASREDVIRRAKAKSRKKTFDNEWIFRAFEDHASFFTKRMFGGQAAYLFGRMMMILVEPTKTGRWKWHGVLLCTDHAQQLAIRAEFPQLAPHEILKKWLYFDSRHEDFEPVMERVAQAIARDDRRFGILPRPRKR